MRLKRVLGRFRRQLLVYRRRPLRLLAALATSTVLTISNVCCLWFCAQALGVHASLFVMLIIFSFGIGLSTAAPTPGGIGGMEAGLWAGLVAYHTPHGLALAVVLLYRLVSYWLPLLLGVVAFIVCQRRQLFVAD
jgi:uncharacterized protein (TIRG00374 family)